MLAALTLAAVGEPSGGGYITHNTEPSAAEVAEHKRLRLLEIDQSLGELLNRKSSAAVFVDTEKRMGPWFAIGSAPFMLIGAIVPQIQGGTVELTHGGKDLNSVAAVGGVLLGIIAVNLAICLGVLIDHWITEADSGPARQRQVDSLRAERLSLGAP
jgi:hypothetical protein